jgi:hypothetical protein
MGAMAGVAGDGEGNIERDGIADDDGFATTGVSADEAGGASVGVEEALEWREEAGHQLDLSFNTPL